jgi:Fic family protein
MDGRPNTSSLVITPEVLAAVASLDEFKGAWRALGQLAPDRLSALRRVASVESVGSSTRIEGSRMTDREVDALLVDLETRSFRNRDEQEVAGYAQVLEAVFAGHEAMPPTETVIRQLHRDLLAHSEKDVRHRGEYKAVPNPVQAVGPDGEVLGAAFETATPFETPACMEALAGWLAEQEERGELHPLLVCGVFTVVFLAIHPFQDGNGRLSRILTTLLLLRAGYAHVPYASLEAVVEERKLEYYRALRASQDTLRGDAPDWSSWLDFFLGALVEQHRRLRAKLDVEIQVFARLPALSQRIVDLVRDHGRVTVADVVAATGDNRNTVKKHVQRLAHEGRLQRHGAGRGAWYGPA